MDNLFDFVDSVLENCIFDLTYHEKIKPLSSMEEELYFQQAVERIESARKMLHMIYIKSLQEQEFLKQKKKELTLLGRLKSWLYNGKKRTKNKKSRKRT
jgi:hypothetical protein